MELCAFKIERHINVVWFPRHRSLDSRAISASASRQAARPATSSTMWAWSSRAQIAPTASTLSCPAKAAPGAGALRPCLGDLVDVHWCALCGCPRCSLLPSLPACASRRDHIDPPSFPFHITSSGSPSPLDFPVFTYFASPLHPWSTEQSFVAWWRAVYGRVRHIGS